MDFIFPGVIKIQLRNLPNLKSPNRAPIVQSENLAFIIIFIIISFVTLNSCLQIEFECKQKMHENPCS